MKSGLEGLLLILGLRACLIISFDCQSPAPFHRSAFQEFWSPALHFRNSLYRVIHIDDRYLHVASLSG